MQVEVVTIDEALRLINPFGFYQWLTIIQYMIHHLIAYINNGFIPYAATMPFWSCSNGTKEFTQDCSIYENCPLENLTLESDFYGITNEYHLICERAFYVGLIASLQQVSALISFPFFGYINDRFGRKWPSVCAMTLQACFGVAASFTSSWQTLAACQFMIGFTLCAKSLIIWPYTAETVTNRERYLLRSIAAAPFIMISGQTLVAFSTRHWRKFILYGNLITVFGVGFLLFMSESPRWLLQKGRMEEAIDVLRRIAKINRNQHKLPKEFVLETVKGKKSNYNMLDIFRSGFILRLFVGYYALYLFTIRGSEVGMWHNLGNLKSATSNVYLSKFITAPLSLASIPMALMEIKFPKKINRRAMIIFLLALIAAANFSIILVAGVGLEDSWVNTGLAATGIAANILCIDLQATFAVELFPTLVRGAAISIGSTVGVLSSTAAPQVLALRFYWYPAPYLIFGSFYVILTIMTVLVLPNTNRMELEEIEKFVAAPTIELDGHLEDPAQRKMAVCGRQVYSGAVGRKITTGQYPALKSEHLRVLEEGKERIKKYSIPFKDGRRAKLTVAGTELRVMVGDADTNSACK